MTDTLKQPAPSSAPLPYEPVPVGGGPAAILDIPRSIPATPPAPRPAPPRQTLPVPPTPAPASVPQPPVVLTPPLQAPLPVGIAPEVPLTPEANPLAGTPAPKPKFSGLVWDLLRPNRAKVAVLAGVASLAAGAFAMPLLFPSLGGAQQQQAKVKLKVPAEEPEKLPTAPAPTPVVPAPGAGLPVPGPLPPLNPTPLPVAKPAESGGWNPLEPGLPALPATGGTGGRGDLPPLPTLDPRQPSGGVGAAGGTAGGATGGIVAPRMPGDVTLPAVPGEFPTHQPTQPVFVDPNLQRTGGQGGTGGPSAPMTPSTPPALPPVGGPLPAAPGGPALPGALPDLPPVGGAGSGMGAGAGPTHQQPSVPALPPFGGPVNPLDDKKPLPLPGGPGGETLPTTPGVLPGVGAIPLPGGTGGGGSLPGLPTTNPGGGGTTGNTGGGPGVIPLPETRPQPQPEIRPLPLPGGPGDTRPQPEVRPLPLPGFPGEVKPLEMKPAQPDLPALPGGGFPAAPPAPRAEVERTGGTGTGFPTAGGTGPAATLQPPVSEPKTEYDVDLHRPRAGDTYATVSKSFYGGTQYADALRAFNRNQPIERIAEVQVPPVHVIRKYAPARAAEPLPDRGGDRDRDRFQPTRQNPDDDPMWGPPGTAQGGQVVYTLFTVPRKGLTLKEVAKTFFGSERNWTKLNNARNPKFDPDEELPVGTQLYVPTETVPFR